MNNHQLDSKMMLLVELEWVKLVKQDLRKHRISNKLIQNKVCSNSKLVSNLNKVGVVECKEDFQRTI